MPKTFDKYEVDVWIRENEDDDACRLLDQELPGMRKRLKLLDSNIRRVLADIQKIFPNAQYYTASGGFHLLLGPAHEDTHNCPPQRQRTAWSGRASIGDGDW